MHVGDYIGLVHRSERELSQAFADVAARNKEEPDVVSTCKLMASWSTEHINALEPFTKRYEEHRENEPEALREAIFKGPRSGGFGLLRDLHDLWLLANESHVSWIVLTQAARALRDEELVKVCSMGDKQNARQLAWLLTRVKQTAPQTLVVPSVH